MNSKLSYMKSISSGFRTDIETLFAKFVAKKSVKFLDFAQCFREMSFSLIFRGRINENEMHEFIDECYLQVLEQLVNETRVESERIAAMFLLYAIYIKQPLDESLTQRLDIKIRITLKQKVIIDKFINECKDKKYYAVCFVWYKLIGSGVHLVHFKYEGMGPLISRNTHYMMASNDSTIVKSVNDLHQSLDLHLNETQSTHELYVEHKQKVMNEELKAMPNVIRIDVIKDLVSDLGKVGLQFLSNDKDMKGRERISSSDKQIEVNCVPKQVKTLNVRKKSKNSVKKVETSGVLLNAEVKKIIKKRVEEKNKDKN